MRAIGIILAGGNNMFNVKQPTSEWPYFISPPVEAIALMHLALKFSNLANGPDSW